MHRELDNMLCAGAGVGDCAIVGSNLLHLCGVGQEAHAILKAGLNCILGGHNGWHDLDGT